MAFDFNWLQTLLTAAFGAGLAWAAARAERSARRREEDRRMLLGKAETTFAALAQFEMGAAKFMMNAVQRLGGVEQSTDGINAALEPVDTLIRLYFPQAACHIDEFISAEKIIAKKFQTDLDAALKSPNVKATQTSLAMYTIARSDLVTKLGKQLRPAIREAIPALKSKS